jgi:hypothetical protein
MPSGPGRVERLVGWCGPVRRVQLLVDAPEGGVDVEAGRGAAPDADLDLPIAGLERGRAAGDVDDPDISVGGVGGDGTMCQVDGDVAMAALTRTSPQASPTQVSPLEFLITAAPSISRIRTLPEPVVTSACPRIWWARSAPAPVLRSSRSARSTWTSPTAVLTRHSPRSSMHRKVDICASPCRCDPVGRSMVTSTEPVLPNKPRPRCFGVLTSSRAASYSTQVCSAARTSWSWDGSPGRTLTTVSTRSLAVIRISPARRSIVTEMGSGMTKLGTTIPSEGWMDVRAPPVAAGGRDAWGRNSRASGGGSAHPAGEALTASGECDARPGGLRRRSGAPRTPPGQARC